MIDAIKPISKVECNTRKDFNYNQRQHDDNDNKRYTKKDVSDKYEIKDTVEIKSYYVGDKEEK